MKTGLEFMAAFLAAVCCFVTGCVKVEVNDVPEQDFYTVNIGMNGEILEITDEPLTRADGNGDIYGIQVYSTPNKSVAEGEKVVWQKYAYGLFDTGKNLNIKLLKGNRYKFVATMIVDGQTKLYRYGSVEAPLFSSPFYITGTNSRLPGIDNKFDYQSSDYFSGLDSGRAYILDGNSYSHPNLERFYGELVDYVPGKSNAKAMIKMKRVSFGAKFIAKGKLAKEGVLEVQMTDAPKLLLDLSVSDKSISDIFSFSNLVKAYEDNNYTETLAVTLNWHRSDETIFPLGTHEITFKRNRTSVIQVSIDNENSDNELGVEIDDTPMEEDDEVTNIEDGEIVDTEVDTNA